jgi:hypothetical protein
MKAFVVRSNDLFDRKKNPGLKLSVQSILENPQIPKFCCRCGTELEILEIYEHGKESTLLVCFKCQEMKHE